MTEQPDEPLYYAKDGVVWQRPVNRKREGGGVNISIGFPVCKMQDAVGDDAAETVAQLMNAGHVVLLSTKRGDNG